MPLFQRVKQKRTKYLSRIKISTHQQLNAYRMEISTLKKTFHSKATFFKNITGPENCKNQEINKMCSLFALTKSVFASIFAFVKEIGQAKLREAVHPSSIKID